MPQCEKCGNNYDAAFTVITADGEKHIFDSFECAIAAVAPRCKHCDCPIIGHGLQDNGTFNCCAHCARKSGVTELQDRA